MGDVTEETNPSGRASKQNESIKVIVRVRPLGSFDGADPSTHSIIDVLNKDTLMINEEKRTFTCSFDSVLSPTSSQVDVYNTLQNCTACVLDGFNSTVFAYGQTGSGKTHSMYGPPMTDAARYNNPSYIGLIPRAISDIFGLIQERAPVGAGGGGASDGLGNTVLSATVYCSFVQIYNESLFDMLRDSKMAEPLSIREEKKEIYVQGLSEYCVQGVDDCMALLRIAEENRAIRETYMNQFSSRSHSIFQIFLEQKLVAPDGQEVLRKSKFNLVDLAGSEKWNIKHNNVMQDNHILEMTNINLSLHTLGRCISALALRSNGRDAHIPYRDSKLTRLLQDSLGGNAKTYLIATISPARTNVEESISTLKFADRAKQVMIQAVINDARPIDHEFVERLKRDNEHLRHLLKQYMPADAYAAYLEEAGTGTGAATARQSRGGDTGGREEGDEGFEQVEAHDALGQAHHIGYVHPLPASHPLIQQQYDTTDPSERQALELRALQVAVSEAQSKNTALEDEVRFYRAEISKYTGDASVSSTLYQSSVASQKQHSAQHVTPTKGTGAKANFSMKGAPKNPGNSPSPTKATSKAAIVGDNGVSDNPGLNDGTLHSSDSLVMTAEDARIAMAAVSSVMTQNTQVWGHLDELHNISQNFFSFVIDEDEYKQKLGVLYDQLQRIRREVISAGAGEGIATADVGVRGSGGAARGKDPIHSLLPAHIVNMIAPPEGTGKRAEDPTTKKTATAPAPAAAPSGGSKSKKQALQELQQQLAESNPGATKTSKPKKASGSHPAAQAQVQPQPAPAPVAVPVRSDNANLNGSLGSSGEYRSMTVRSRSASPKLTLNDAPPTNNSALQKLHLQVRYAGKDDGVASGGSRSIGKPTMSSGGGDHHSLRSAGNNDNKNFGSEGTRKVKKRKEEAPPTKPVPQPQVQAQANIGACGVGGAKRSMKMLAGIGGGGVSAAPAPASAPIETSLPMLAPAADTTSSSREAKATKAAANLIKQQHRQQQQQQKMEDSYRDLVAGYDSSELYDDQAGTQANLPAIHSLNKPHGGSKPVPKAGGRKVVAEPSPPIHTPGQGGLNIASRIRTSVNADDTQWLQSTAMTEEEEEAMLEAEIRNTKKQLRKQEKLKEYKQSKEEKARLALERELRDRQEAEDAEREKERQRKARADKSKTKLKQYSDQIRTEAETIKDLIALGIDPSSLVLPTN